MLKPWWKSRPQINIDGSTALPEPSNKHPRLTPEQLPDLWGPVPAVEDSSDLEFGHQANLAAEEAYFQMQPRAASIPLLEQKSCRNKHYVTARVECSCCQTDEARIWLAIKVAFT